MNAASSGDAGPYVVPCPRPDERDEPFPGAEAWGIMTADQHEMYRYFLKIDDLRSLTCEAERREGFSDAVPARCA